jgi:hypothetical protein
VFGLLIHVNDNNRNVITEKNRSRKSSPHKVLERLYTEFPEYPLGFAVLRYGKRGVGENHTILDANVWGNLTMDDLMQDAEKALAVLRQ